jgi:hypothetical protein
MPKATMKTIRTPVLIIGLAVLALMAWLVWKKIPHGPAPIAPVAAAPPSIPTIQTDEPTNGTQRPHLPQGRMEVKRMNDFTDTEKTELTNLFNTKLRPAAQRWFAAYSNRVPFNLDDLTLEKFTNRLGKRARLHTFVMGDTTLVIQDTSDTAKVCYMMSRKGAVALNNLPSPGTIPDLSMPVTRADVSGMVKADTGVQFKPNEIVMRPTAAASGVNGGAYVNVISTGDDPNNGLSSKVTLIFGADGKLVNYERLQSF